MADANRILVEYEDGSIRELKKGIAAEFDYENMKVEMIDISKLDLVRIAYGMLVTVERMGMTPLLKSYVSGELLPDEL